MAAEGKGVANLNPYVMIKDLQNFIGQNKLYLIILTVLIALIAAYMLYSLYEQYMGIPTRERKFTRGKSNFMAALRVEILDRMKRKRGGRPPI